MSNTLVAFFSATGTTAKLANGLSKEIGADLYEIKPAKPYTTSDLNWVNPLSRTMREYIGKSTVEIAGKKNNMADYDTIILGFPIWFFKEPNIIRTFLKQYNFDGKTMSFFVTSHKVGTEKSEASLKKLCPNAHWQQGMLANGKNVDDLKSWASTFISK